MWLSFCYSSSLKKEKPWVIAVSLLLGHLDNQDFVNVRDTSIRWSKSPKTVGRFLANKEAAVCPKSGKFFVRVVQLCPVLTMQKEDPKSDLYNSRYASPKFMASNQCQH